MNEPKQQGQFNAGMEVKCALTKYTDVKDARCRITGKRWTSAEGGPKGSFHFDVLDALGHEPQPLVPAIQVDIVVCKLNGHVQEGRIVGRGGGSPPKGTAGRSEWREKDGR